MADMEKDLEKGMPENEVSDAENMEAEAVAAEAEGVMEEADEVCEDCEACEESEEADGAEASQDASEKTGKGPSKWLKKNNKDKEKIAELEDRVMRQMAEFENFRRRTDKEKQAMFETGAKSVIEKILPVIDNFERGLSTVPEAERETGFASGMNMIYKQLLTELENIGVKPIEALGQEFDPNLHNAVMQVASDEYESGVVAQELLKGYTYRDTVVRYSMVAVVE
ncbi:MAG: nucleotide exchange factor GrpE [Lachnospiraceae bacterium]|nr:nucleotide exchange factor GrpE [Lachnospiraceae bacterium]